MNDYILSIGETPVNISAMGLYEKYQQEAQSLYRQVRSMPEKFIESAFDLFNERLLDEGNIPDVNDIVCQIHADEIIEVHGHAYLH